MTVDLQAAYLFLLDRHNRGELNLNKLGVVAVGEGANLAAAWAATPGAAVSTQGRNSDLAALVLVSPTAIEGREGLESVLTTLAPRVPLLLMVGERDTDSNASVKAVRPFVERTKTNKIELVPLLAPRLQAAVARAQGLLGPHPLPGLDAQVQGRRVGAPLQPEPGRLHRHPGRAQHQVRHPRQGQGPRRRQGQGQGRPRQGQGCTAREGQGRTTRPRPRTHHPPRRMHPGRAIPGRHEGALDAAHPIAEDERLPSRTRSPSPSLRVPRALG